MIAFQTIFVPLCALISMVMFVRTVRGSITRRIGLLWTVLWMAASILIATPSSTTVIAGWLGIDRGADLVAYMTTLGGLAACLYFYVRCRRLEVVLTGLARREALASARRGGALNDSALETP